MAGRSSTTFKKRQKELARQDRQREKAAKRVQRKMEKQVHGPDDGVYVPDEDDMSVDTAGSSSRGSNDVA